MIQPKLIRLNKTNLLINISKYTYFLNIYLTNHDLPESQLI
jgi:hypothetical protein